jgi:cytochrome bd-type quinol oxidase subunit 2
MSRKASIAVIICVSIPLLGAFPIAIKSIYRASLISLLLYIVMLAYLILQFQLKKANKQKQQLLDSLPGEE